MVKAKEWLSHKRYALFHRIAGWKYQAASPRGYFLPDDVFSSVIKPYERLEAKPFQDYSMAAMVQRGKTKADKLTSLIPQERLHKVLEIGASDGFVLKELLERGARRAVNVDICDHLDPEVKKAGVELELANAEDMASLKSNSFDLIYSWGAFEHILHIENVMSECKRLLTAQGVIYVEAGPLYYSPWGYHYYSVLRMPYVHLLFRPEILRQYAMKKKGRIDFPWTSGNSFSRYLGLVQNLSPDFELIDFWHGYDWFSAGVIAKYPAVFRSKQVSFDDFFIDTVKITLRKK